MATADRPWMDTTKTPRERAELVVEAMTLEQKVDQLGGAVATTPSDNQPETLRHVAPVEELGIPSLNITHGPVGVGQGTGTPSSPATALPATLGLAAAFDVDLAYRYGERMGIETKALGQHLLEAPGMGLTRVTTGGRNFEYFSEDPYLSGVMGVEVTKGIQTQNVIAGPKHFALNDSESQRSRYDVKADEQVMRELYLLPFEMAVKDAKPGAIVSSHQQLNGTYASENHWLLTQVLREQWGFEGYVQSASRATRSTAQALNAGLDHEMPNHHWMTMENIQHALDQRILETATIDRALVRRYTQMFRFGMFDETREATGVDDKTGRIFAREASREAIVLLKNDRRLLPLDPARTGKVLLVGIDDFANRISTCGGSAQATPTHEVPPAEGLRNVLAEQGADSEVEVFTVADDMSNLAEVEAAAADAGTVVIMAGLTATESVDREGMNLPKHQNQLIDRLAEANDRTVVVLKNGNPVLMPWLEKVHTLLEAFNQGQEDGHAVADVLIGNHNPSAKLPLSYPAAEADTCYAHNSPSRYPGEDEGAGYPVMRYSEGLEMGYRWHQSQNITPLFAFGHGLSYTTFELDDLRVEPTDLTSGAAASGTLEITVDVTNTGDHPGAEVVQAYAEIPVAGQPPRRLVGFDKVHVSTGSTVEARITLDLASSSHPLSVWDANEQAFVVKPGTYTLHVGTSSVDTPLTASGEIEG